MIIFIQRMEIYCILLHFSRKLSHVFICELPLCVYQIPSVYTANIYLVERQGYAFMLFVFQSIRTCKEQNITGMTVCTLKFFCMTSVSQFSDFISIQIFAAFLQIYLYFGSLTTWWQLEHHQQERSELCIHQQMLWLSWNGFMHWNVWCWESHVCVISESILQANFSADSWADWFIILDLLHFPI